MYLNKIKEVSNVSKYTKCYIAICERAKQRISSNTKTKARKEATLKVGYVEAHHIFPRAMCSSIDEEKDFDNLVFLTFREHVICHLLLTKMLTGSDKHKMIYACNSFSFNLSSMQRDEKSRISSRTLELMRMVYSKERSRMSSGENNPNYGGKLQTEEVKAKMRKPKLDSSKMGRWERTPENIKNMSDARKGKGLGDKNAMASAENRAKVGASKVGRKIAINQETKERRYVFPNNIPEGFVLKSSLK